MPGLRMVLGGSLLLWAGAVLCGAQTGSIDGTVSDSAGAHNRAPRGKKACLLYTSLLSKKPKLFYLFWNPCCALPLMARS